MTRALGIDIGKSHIKIAEIDVTARSREVLGLYEIKREENLDPGLQLKEFLSTSGVSADRYVFGLCSAPAYVKQVSFPFGDRKKVSAAIHAEIEDSVPFPIDNYIIDYQLISKTGRFHNFSVGLCPKTWVENLNKIAETANIMPWAFYLDAEALGQHALYQQLPAANEDDLFAIIDLDFENTKVSIVRGTQPDPQDRKARAPQNPGQVMEFRSINKGSSELVHWIKNEKNITHEEAVQWLVHRAEIKTDSSTKTDSEENSLSDTLSDEVKIALRPIVVELYQTFQAFRGRTSLSPSTIYLTGSMSDIKGLRDFIGEELRVSVFSWPIFLGFQTEKTPITEGKERSFAVALSLAFRIALKKPNGWLNFRRSPQATRKILSSALSQLKSPEIKPAFMLTLSIYFGFFIYSITASHFIKVQREEAKIELQNQLRPLSVDAARIVTRAESNYLKLTKESFEKEKQKRLLVENPNKKDSIEKPRGEIIADFSMATPKNASLHKIQIKKTVEAIEVAGLFNKAAADETPFDVLKTQYESTLRQKGYEEFNFSISGEQIDFSAKWKGKKQ